MNTIFDFMTDNCTVVTCPDNQGQGTENFLEGSIKINTVVSVMLKFTFYIVSPFFLKKLRGNKN